MNISDTHIFIHTYVQGTKRNRQGGMTSQQTNLLRTGTAITGNWTRPDRTSRGVELNGPTLCGTTEYLDWTGPDLTRPGGPGGLDWTGPDRLDRTGPNRIRLDWAEPTRSAPVSRGMHEFDVADLDQTGPSRTGLNRNGPDRTGPDQMRYGTERSGTVSFQAKGGAEVQTGFTGGLAEDRNEENQNEA